MAKSKSPKKAASETRSDLGQSVDGLAEELRVNLLESLEGDTHAIHDARVATRRLRAVVDLFASHLSPRLKTRFTRSLKQIRRTLGAVRDIDVMIEHLEKLGSLDADSAAFLVKCLTRRREIEMQTLANLNAPKLLGKLGSWWGLREQMKDDLAWPLLRNSLKIQLEQFCRQADEHSQTKGDAGVAPDPSGEPKELNPHDLRIAGKALRYTLEMSVKDHDCVPQNVIVTFKKMQEMLGLWHDHIVLMNHVLQIIVDEELGYHNARLLAGSLKIAQAASRRADRHLLEFVKLWRKKGAELHTMISAAIEDPVPDASSVSIPAESISVTDNDSAPEPAQNAQVPAESNGKIE